MAAAVHASQPLRADVVEAMLERLNRRDDAVHKAIARLFNRCASSGGLRLNRRMVNTICETIADETFDRYGAQCLIEALRSRRNTAVADFLIDRLKSCARDQKVTILQHVAKVATKRQLIGVTAMLSDPDDLVRYAAIGALRRGRVTAAIPQLAGLLTDRSNRVPCAYALSELGGQEALDALRLVAESTDGVLKKIIDKILPTRKARRRTR